MTCLGPYRLYWSERKSQRSILFSEQDPEAQQTLAIVCCLMHQSLQISKHCLCCFFVNIKRENVYFPLWKLLSWFCCSHAKRQQYTCTTAYQSQMALYAYLCYIHTQTFWDFALLIPCNRVRFTFTDNAPYCVSLFECVGTPQTLITACVWPFLLEVSYALEKQVIPLYPNYKLEYCPLPFKLWLSSRSSSSFQNHIITMDLNICLYCEKRLADDVSWI